MANTRKAVNIQVQDVLMSGPSMGAIRRACSEVTEGVQTTITMTPPTADGAEPAKKPATAKQRAAAKRAREAAAAKRAARAEAEAKPKVKTAAS
jgi:hypothetical protein